MGISVIEDSMASSRPSSPAPLPGQITRSMNKRILSSLLTGVEVRRRSVRARLPRLSKARCVDSSIALKLPPLKSKNQSAEMTQESLVPLVVPPLPRTPPRRIVGLRPVDNIERKQKQRYVEIFHSRHGVHESPMPGCLVITAAGVHQSTFFSW